MTFLAWPAIVVAKTSARLGPAIISAALRKIWALSLSGTCSHSCLKYNLYNMHRKVCDGYDCLYLSSYSGVSSFGDKIFIGPVVFSDFLWVFVGRHLIFDVTISDFFSADNDWDVFYLRLNFGQSFSERDALGRSRCKTQNWFIHSNWNSSY